MLCSFYRASSSDEQNKMPCSIKNSSLFDNNLFCVRVCYLKFWDKDKAIVVG